MLLIIIITTTAINWINPRALKKHFNSISPIPNTSHADEGLHWGRITLGWLQLHLHTHIYLHTHGPATCTWPGRAAPQPCVWCRSSGFLRSHRGRSISVSRTHSCLPLRTNRSHVHPLSRLFGVYSVTFDLLSAPDHILAISGILRTRTLRYKHHILNYRGRYFIFFMLIDYKYELLY